MKYSKIKRALPIHATTVNAMLCGGDCKKSSVVCWWLSRDRDLFEGGFSDFCLFYIPTMCLFYTIENYIVFKLNFYFEEAQTGQKYSDRQIHSAYYILNICIYVWKETKQQYINIVFRMRWHFFSRYNEYFSSQMFIWGIFCQLCY